MSGEQNLRKYHDESTKVSRVSVSLVYFFPFIITCFHFGCWSIGLPLTSRFISSGSLMGKSFSGTGKALPFSS